MTLLDRHWKTKNKGKKKNENTKIKGDGWVMNEREFQDTAISISEKGWQIIVKSKIRNVLFYFSGLK